MPGSSKSPRWLTPSLLGFVIIACAFFTLRGPSSATAPGGNYDFTLIYPSARAWLHGQNPYQRDSVSQAWLSSGAPADRDPMIVRGPATLVYPPPALVLVAPLAALPWPIASWAWALLNTAFAAFSLSCLARLARLSRNSSLALLGLGLVFAPLALNAKQGQTAAFVLFGICFAALARARGRQRCSGLLLGLGAALKPQLGLLFVLYEAGRLRWKSFAFAAIAIAALTAVGAGRMSAAGIDWWPTYRQNIHDFTTSDDANATKINTIRYQMINLHYPLHNFTDNRVAVRFAVYAIVGALCLAYFIVDLKRQRQASDQPGELVSLSFVSAVTLMVAYHRPYDAVIVVIPLALAIHRLAAGQMRHAFTLALILLHTLPFPILFTELARRGHIPESLSKSALFQNVLLPCQAYGLVALALWLIWIRWTEPAAPASPIMRKST